MMRAITHQLVTSAPVQATSEPPADAVDVTAVAPPSEWHEVPMFQSGTDKGTMSKSLYVLHSNDVSC